jgi:polyisoprenoid-binding protein YceI
MKLEICISLLALAAWAPACQSSESASATKTATAEPTAGEPAATPKATDPASVKMLALDPAASKFDFQAAKITKTHNGVFKQFSGAVTLIGDDLQSIAAEVDTASIEADDPKLTGHLKSPDFLDVEKFPKATFKSSHITKKPAGGATHEVSGALTLHGVTQEVTFPATVSVTPASVTASGEVRIDRQKFGVIYPGMPDDLIKNEVVLKPHFVFTKM